MLDLICWKKYSFSIITVPLRLDSNLQERRHNVAMSVLIWNILMGFIIPQFPQS